MVPLEFQKVNIQPIEAQWLHNGQLTLDVLRLDELHPIISGNKWFKLQYYLHEALELQKQTVATFGGAWSNHIIATAFACKEAGLRSLGIIRGEEPKQLSPTLQYAMDYGMKLHFVSRERYRNKQAVKAGISDTDHYWIDEGGFGLTGAKGASEILQLVNSSTYSHIICAVGTGTMLAGLLIAANEGQQLIGISSMKGNLALEQQILALTAPIKQRASFTILHDYHFGGYGKHPLPLLTYMNDVYLHHHLPLDMVYTAKTFFAIEDLARKKFFAKGSKILMIHSGGLQGNKSLSPQVLAF